VLIQINGYWSSVNVREAMVGRSAWPPVGSAIGHRHDRDTISDDQPEHPIAS
jgi:hypothetical protein